MLRALCALAFAVLTAAPTAAQTTVGLSNATRPTACAEEDNVTVMLAGRGVATFTITAEHPPYTASLTRDSTAPDFRGCDFSADPAFSFPPRRVVLHDGDRWQLVGHTFASYWRPSGPPVRVSGGEHGERVEADLHLLQLFSKAVSPPIEFLVLYPADGYWRVKPLPPPQLADSAYGSSFLIGPIEIDGRPLVRLDEVHFEPAHDRLRLRFAAGSEASLKVSAITPEHAVLDVALSQNATDGRPFAALRSMFVTAEVADVAEISLRMTANDAWQTEPILDFRAADALAVRFGRSVPSRHNTSAPDLLFDGFRPAVD